MLEHLNTTAQAVTRDWYFKLAQEWYFWHACLDVVQSAHIIRNLQYRWSYPNK